MRRSTIYDLDQAASLALAENSPSLIAEAATSVLIDEYQKVPSILDAIKAQLNTQTEPGMFVLAGSSSFDALPRNTQALTGRIQRLGVHPLTQTEIDGSDNDLLMRLSTAKLGRLDPAALTEFGHLLESFVVQEVIRHASWLDAPWTKLLALPG